MLLLWCALFLSSLLLSVLLLHRAPLVCEILRNKAWFSPCAISWQLNPPLLRKLLARLRVPLRTLQQPVWRPSKMAPLNWSQQRVRLERKPGHLSPVPKPRPCPRTQLRAALPLKTKDIAVWPAVLMGSPLRRRLRLVKVLRTNRNH